MSGADGYGLLEVAPEPEPGGVGGGGQVAEGEAAGQKPLRVADIRHQVAQLLVPNSRLGGQFQKL